MLGMAASRQAQECGVGYQDRIKMRGSAAGLSNRCVVVCYPVDSCWRFIFLRLRLFLL